MVEGRLVMVVEGSLGEGGGSEVGDGGEPLSTSSASAGVGAGPVGDVAIEGPLEAAAHLQEVGHHHIRAARRQPTLDETNCRNSSSIL